MVTRRNLAPLDRSGIPIVPRPAKDRTQGWTTNRALAHLRRVACSSDRPPDFEKTRISLRDGCQIKVEREAGYPVRFVAYKIMPQTGVIFARYDLMHEPARGAREPVTADKGGGPTPTK